MIRRRLALVTPDFVAKVQRLVHTLVYKTPGFKGGRKYLSVFAVKDPEDPNDPGYFYVERLGKDSVAILFRDSANEEKPWVCLEQYHSPLRGFNRGAFTGSLDKPDLDPIAIAQEEALEEAGYRVQREQIKQVGFQPVSANTNERVHLFVIDVTDQKMDKAEPENIFEANTHIVRLSTAEVFTGCEWKAQLIVLQWTLAKARGDF